MKLLSYIKTYLTDIKNLLTHALIGVGILVAAIYLPVSAPVRIGILVLVITGNIIRMRISKKKEQETVEETA